MRSIKEIFVIGHGPSSSHTMGPANACKYVLSNYKDIAKIEVTLYGSLARTGKGHFTDYIIKQKLKNYPCEIIFDNQTRTKHPNTMVFKITDSEGKEHTEKILSIGGGTIIAKDNYNDIGKEIFPHESMTEILKYCEENSLSLKDYVMKFEDSDIRSYLYNCFEHIQKCIEKGRSREGILPGKLNVHRKSKTMFETARNGNIEDFMMASAFAVAEENASASEVVIAPTCGSAGVFGGITGYLTFNNYSKDQIIDAFLVSGLVGIICKTNGSVSGAEAAARNLPPVVIVT